MKSKGLLFIIGTRPELIKLFPIIDELKKRGYENYRILSTGQHKSLLESYWKLFDIEVDYELNVLNKGQSIADLTARTIQQLNNFIKEIESDFKPEYIIGQGDTTTVMVASMVAFYNGIKYAHIEAGLRSYDLAHPFPEEYNRKLVSIATDIHFAPTKEAKLNLIAEGVCEQSVDVVGNTVIDTLHYFIKSGKLDSHEFENLKLKNIGSRCVLITCHRRENHLLLENLISAVTKLANKYPEISFVWTLHPNPKVRDVILNSKVSQISNLLLVDPLSYLDLIKIMSSSSLILTDSGGIQEEAPTFKVPVLVLREKTERPEAIKLGVSKLVGMNEKEIIESFESFKPNFDDDFVNPYGEGNSSTRIVRRLIE